jgi:hypothetical protein
MYQLGAGELATKDLGLPTRNISSGVSIYQYEPHKIFFNPAVPFLYVNTKDFERMSTNFT